MPCKEYKDLEIQLKSARAQWAQFTYEQNRHLRGVGDRKAKQIAKEAQANQTEVSRSMSWHREHCEECKKEA
jgi:hypothetical protein